MSDVMARTTMLIRAPISDVFGAFADGRRIREFWLNSTTGPLTVDARVEWEFMLPGARETVEVMEFVRNGHIKFRWSNGNVVDMTFDRRAALLVFASNPASNKGAGFTCTYDFGFAEARFQAMIMKGLLVLAQFHTFKDDSKRASYFLREYYSMTHEHF